MWNSQFHMLADTLRSDSMSLISMTTCALQSRRQKALVPYYKMSFSKSWHKVNFLHKILIFCVCVCVKLYTLIATLLIFPFGQTKYPIPGLTQEISYTVSQTKYFHIFLVCQYIWTFIRKPSVKITVVNRFAKCRLIWLPNLASLCVNIVQCIYQVIHVVSIVVQCSFSDYSRLHILVHSQSSDYKQVIFCKLQILESSEQNQHCLLVKQHKY
jgi:hypothetical protein